MGTIFLAGRRRGSRFCWLLVAAALAIIPSMASAGQTQGTLSVRVRVVERCEMTVPAHARKPREDFRVTRSCAGKIPAMIARERVQVGSLARVHSRRGEAAQHVDVRRDRSDMLLVTITY